MNSRIIFLRMFLLSMILLPLSSWADDVLTNCFSGLQEYSIDYSQELSDSDNKQGKKVDSVGGANGHLVGSGGTMYANCECPKNMKSSASIRERGFVGSPLPPGTSGYGYLTDAIDINVHGYPDASDSQDAVGLNGNGFINTYPTPMGSMYWVGGSTGKTESTADVCNEATRPSGVTAPKRVFKWNVIGAVFYIKKPIIGEEIIPRQIVVQNYSCLYYGSSNYCNDVGNSQHVSNIWLGGTLSAPLSYTINAGSTINVDLGTTTTSSFSTKDQPPSSYTLRDVNISYHCTDPAISNDDKIKLTLTADQGTTADSGGVIAKTLDRDDIGVRMYDANDNNVVLDGSVEFPITLDEQGNGIIEMKAAPVSTTTSKPSAGEYQSDVTVKMELR